MLMPPLSLGLGLLYGLEGRRTLSSVTGKKCLDNCEAEFAGGSRKFCLRSRRTLSLREAAVERKAARNLDMKSNNVVGSY